MTTEAMWTAIRARFDDAFALAKAVEPTIELIIAGANRKSVRLDPETTYQRAYFRHVGARRVGATETAPEENQGIIYQDFLAPLQVGDDTLVALFDAVRPAFRTGADGLEFEEAPHLRDGRADGSHWLAVASFPFVRREIVAAA